MDLKVLKIVLNETGKIDEKYDGYRTDLAKLATEIIIAESEHEISRTHIVGNISTQINRVGMSLYKARKSEEA